MSPQFHTVPLRARDWPEPTISVVAIEPRPGASSASMALRLNWALHGFDSFATWLSIEEAQQLVMALSRACAEYQALEARTAPPIPAPQSDNPEGRLNA